MGSRSPLVVLLVCSVAGTACSNLPRDPEHTLTRVQQQHHVRVGIVENPPWVIRTAREPQGAEVELIRRFAASIGATPDWFWGGEQQHLEALERFELDVVIGGLDATTPWTKKVGLTRPYFTEAVAVGIPPTMPPLETLKGANVETKGGEATAAYLIKNDATPVRVATISHPKGPAAAPVWRLRQLGLTVTKFELLKQKHVMAVPPGENGWLKRLEDFLHQQQAQIEDLLKASDPQV